ncbi:MAG: hypothetical protein EOP83_14110 [Verrucomicrobiaceae bacterium]|nr:MAG: hypothetical protein EOP83_14110 [Verrucomicrobiaceae bacterium]
MDQPYLPPEAPANPPSPEEIIARRLFWKRALWGSALLTIIPPLIGIAMTVTGMTRAFNELESAGGGDSEQLSTHVGTALIGTAIGLLVGLVGLILLVISIMGYRRSR